MLAHSPGGALVVGTWAGGPGGIALCGVQTPPGTADVAGFTAARMCDVPSASAADEESRGHRPAGRRDRRHPRRPHRLLATVPLAAGSTVVALPALPAGAATVRTVDAAGRPVTEVPVAPVATAPFGDFESGPQR
ncbi:MAG: polymerase, sigma-24 subunit, subfamily [Modestobacter sp.]|nr:polymerase, sigma-24 subunit, subfamily [Modestobacter sp.]